MRLALSLSLLIFLAKDMTIVLGIESSCDDTGVAIVKGDGQILSNCIDSQLKQHITNGGIIPMLAKEFHVYNIDKVARQAFEQSNLESMKQVDAIAVTTRPGLVKSLEVGLNYARILAKKYCRPLIPIHHMQAHALMPLLERKSIKFPFITLLISGGHSLLAIVERYNKFHLLGSSLDEAPGDVLDKVARRCRLKNLGKPFDSVSGGAAIEILSQIPGADAYRYFNNDYSVPMHMYKSCDFSFSGYRGKMETYYPHFDELWTAGNQENLLGELSHLCSSLQRAILIQLCKKLQRAIYYYKMHWRYEHTGAFGVENQSNHLGFDLRGLDDDNVDIVVSGGCAANNYFIQGLRRFCLKEIDADMQVFSPSKHLCNDNGLMIAWNGLLRYKDFKQRLETSTDAEKLSPSGLTRTFCDKLDNSVLLDESDTDVIEAESSSDIGEDLRPSVRTKDFVLSKFKDPELKFARSADKNQIVNKQ